MSDYTAYLFARPSFIEGMARLFDFAGALNQYNTSPTPKQADALALACDWKQVGADMQHAIDQYAAEMEKKKQ